MKFVIPSLTIGGQEIEAKTMHFGTYLVFLTNHVEGKTMCVAAIRLGATDNIDISEPIDLSQVHQQMMLGFEVRLAKRKELVLEITEALIVTGKGDKIG